MGWLPRCRRRTRPSPRKKPRRRVVVDDDDEEEDAPAADAADPLPAPDAPAAAPVPATPPVVVTQAAPMETEPTVPATPAAPEAPLETEPAAPSAPWAPPPRVRPPSSDATALAAAAALAEARSAVDAFRSGDADERLVDDDDTRAARRAGVLRFATAAPRPSTGADRAAASLGVDLLVAAPTPAPVRERHRDALYAARCAVGDDLAPPRLGPEPALDYAPALRAIFGGEAAREATFAGRPSRAALGVGLAYAAGDLPAVVPLADARAALGVCGAREHDHRRGATPSSQAVARVLASGQLRWFHERDGGSTTVVAIGEGDGALRHEVTNPYHFHDAGRLFARNATPPRDAPLAPPDPAAAPRLGGRRAQHLRLARYASDDLRTIVAPIKRFSCRAPPQRLLARRRRRARAGRRAGAAGRGRRRR